MKTETKGKGAGGKEPAQISQLIQERAYERYVERGKEPGHELEDWLKAEEDIRCKEELQATQ